MTMARSAAAAPPALLLALLLAALVPRAADAFGFNSVVALVLSDVTTPFPGANVSIVEVRALVGPEQSAMVAEMFR